MLTAAVFEFIRPINSSMILAGCPAAGMTVGAEMSRAIGKNYMEKPLRATNLIRQNILLFEQIDRYSARVVSSIL